MAKKKINVGILWADPYNGNLGVGALAYSSLFFLNDIIKEIGYEANFSFVCSSEYKKDTIQIGNSSVSFDSFPGLNYLKPKSWVNLALFPSKFGTKKLFSFDFVFDISAGDSFADIYGKRRFDLMLNSKKFFSLFGKRQVLLPQTIGPFKDAEIEKKAFKLMKSLDFVISRDEQSYNYTAQHLPREKIAETIDIAFYMPYNKRSFDNQKINVGINVSGLLWNGGYTRNNQFEMTSDYQSLIRDCLSYFTSNEAVEVHLIPHVIPDNDAVEDDYAVSLKLKEEFPDVIVPTKFTSPIDAKSYISGLDFFTGARMHSCIAAFSSGVPVYLMAYSRKFNGLFGKTLKYDWLGDCVNENNATILERLKSAFINRSELKEQISVASKSIIQPRLNLLKKLLVGVLNKGNK